MLTGLTPATSPALLIVSYVVFGIGFGSVNPPITNTAGLGHAAGAGRRRLRRRLHEPPGRPVARRRARRGDRRRGHD